MAHPDHELLRIALELSPTGILAIDERGTIVLVNREIERMFGYSRDELLGRQIDLLVPERFRSAHPGFRRTFFAAPQARPMGAGRDLFGLRKDGKEIPIEIGLSPVETSEGRLVLSSIVDITARRQLEDRLRQSQKMEAIGTLAGGIAHDFNNVLRAVIGYSELVASAVADRQTLEDISQIRRAAERGQQLVQRILAFGRQRELARTPMTLDRPVRDAVELLRASLPRTIDLRTYFDPEAPPVVADDSQIHQIVMNVVTNAAQALEQAPGTVEVSLTPFQAAPGFLSRHARAKPGLYTRLTVRDSGPGMSDDVKARAFEPFFTTKALGSGTGLGLAVVQGIVESYGGFVEIDSRVGEGTTVHVYFPAIEPSTVDEDTAPDAHAPRPHVLLVEDEELIAALSKRQLEDQGFRVTACTSSLQALEEFRARPSAFDVVVTDNTMPRMTGMALAQEMLRLRPGTRILLVSGLAETLDPGVLYAKGISGILAKPHTGRELAEAVRGLIAPEDALE
ncbi:MAG TPA: PAS domain S-box protein [Vicinamibacterales bacterium]